MWCVGVSTHTECFLHSIVCVVTVFAVVCGQILHVLCDFERELNRSESQVFGRNETGQKDVDTLTYTERHRNNTVRTRFACQHTTHHITSSHHTM